MAGLEQKNNGRGTSIVPRTETGMAFQPLLLPITVAAYYLHASCSLAPAYSTSIKSIDARLARKQVQFVRMKSHALVFGFSVRDNLTRVMSKELFRPCVASGDFSSAYGSLSCSRSRTVPEQVFASDCPATARAQNYDREDENRNESCDAEETSLSPSEEGISDLSLSVPRSGRRISSS